MPLTCHQLTEHPHFHLSLPHKPAPPAAGPLNGSATFQLPKARSLIRVIPNLLGYLISAFKMLPNSVVSHHPHSHPGHLYSVPRLCSGTPLDSRPSSPRHPVTLSLIVSLSAQTLQGLPPPLGVKPMASPWPPKASRDLHPHGKSYSYLTLFSFVHLGPATVTPTLGCPSSGMLFADVHRACSLTLRSDQMSPSHDPFLTTLFKTAAYPHPSTPNPLYLLTHLFPTGEGKKMYLHLNTDTAMPAPDTLPHLFTIIRIYTP